MVDLSHEGPEPNPGLNGKQEDTRDLVDLSHEGPEPTPDMKEQLESTRDLVDLSHEGPEPTPDMKEQLETEGLWLTSLVRVLNLPKFACIDCA